MEEAKEVKEIWRPIDRVDGFYEVSNLGRIKRLRRYYRSPQNGKLLLLPEKILVPTKINSGYLKVAFRYNSERYEDLIHRFVAESFVQNPYCYNEVNHINENKEDNRASNLQWTTHRQNINHSRNVGKITSDYIGVCWNKKINKWQSSIHYNGKYKWLGYFIKEEDAAQAYINFCKENNLKF